MVAPQTSQAENASMPQGEALKKLMPAPSKKAKKISTYVSVIAGFSEMIKRMQKQFHLNFDQVESELGMYVSNLKDALYSEIISMHAIKNCVDDIDELKAALGLVKKAKTLSHVLKEKGIRLDTPMPDLDYINGNIEETIDRVEEINAKIVDIQREQNAINETFLTESKELINQIKKLLKEEGYAFTASELEANLIRMFSVLRHKMALEEKERSGKILTSAEKQFHETADNRAISALLNTQKKSKSPEEKTTRN